MASLEVSEADECESEGAGAASVLDSPLSPLSVTMVTVGGFWPSGNGGVVLPRDMKGSFCRPGYVHH